MGSFWNGQLCVIDDKSTKITKTYNVVIFNNISPIENKFLLSDDYGITHSMFDITAEENTYLDVESAMVINNSLIFIDKEKIKGVNPLTLETLWWIDVEENMKNANVEWLDWRGVLVETKDHVYCYALK